MANQVRNRFKILLAQKEMTDGRNYTYEDIYQETGIAPNTLTSYAQGRVERFDGTVLARLCDFFDCEISDLLEYPPVTRQQDGIGLIAVATA